MPKASSSRRRRHKRPRRCVIPFQEIDVHCRDQPTNSLEKDVNVAAPPLFPLTPRKGEEDDHQDMDAQAENRSRGLQSFYSPEKDIIAAPWTTRRRDGDSDESNDEQARKEEDVEAEGCRILSFNLMRREGDSDEIDGIERTEEDVEADKRRGLWSVEEVLGRVENNDWSPPHSPESTRQTDTEDSKSRDSPIYKYNYQDDHSIDNDRRHGDDKYTEKSYGKEEHREIDNRDNKLEEEDADKKRRYRKKMRRDKRKVEEQNKYNERQCDEPKTYTSDSGLLKANERHSRLQSSNSMEIDIVTSPSPTSGRDDDSDEVDGRRGSQPIEEQDRAENEEPRRVRLKSIIVVPEQDQSQPALSPEPKREKL
ncbi:hypothetical protein TIFTF001_003311 [Ficus carica]|uniref:Uncharacterized protein n=1 Tax=Ficus carica TaxID=3494 RepID=A0AA87ZCQ4_FICCA|nr:hypothetical protein TIFTF001_003311 [Ficus carica]